VDHRAAHIDRALRRLRVSRADEEAWASLYDSVVPLGRAIAYRLLGGDAAAAQDVVHDTLERLLRYSDFEKLDSAESFVRYFSTSVRHKTIDALKLRRSSVAMAASSTVHPDQEGEAIADTGWLEQIPDEGPSPEDTLSLKRAWSDLQQKLSEREQLVGSLLVKGYRLREIAARLGVSANTAAVIVFRMREKLR
jgi:RNA polymerase sigma factor (sigma-70 family)